MLNQSVFSARSAIVVAATLSIIAGSAPVASAQDRDNERRRNFACESVDGQRQYCPVDQPGSVQMTRQLGERECVEGSTWGREERGVWVDRGCRAQFTVSPEPMRSPAVTRIEPGTVLPVRTNDYISSDRADGRIFTGTVDRDVMGEDGNLAIPRGSTVELIVRNAQDGDLVLDLESVMVDGRRYALDAAPDRIDADKKDGVGANERTGKFVGGGALLGAIIGGVAGGGKGAAIGAGAGAVTGAATETATRGREVKVPSESILTFRIDRPLTMGVADHGNSDNGRHYHDDDPR